LCEDELKFDFKFVKRALDLEKELGYMIPSGKYWEYLKEFDHLKLNEVDSLWLKSVSKVN
jgi:hypothetical protein